jgi:transcriptional regulator with XRE-family HTH domain
MASVSDKRHAGGRPRVHQPSDLFVRVRDMAKRRGMHLDELADKAGIPIGTLYQLRDPRVSTAKAIANALGVTVDRLICPPRRSAGRSTP